MKSAVGGVSYVGRLSIQGGRILEVAAVTRVGGAAPKALASGVNQIAAHRPTRSDDPVR